MTVAECKYVTEGSQLVFLSERAERKRNHLHFASGSKCRWNDQMQERTVMKMTVSHNPKFPAAFCAVASEGSQFLSAFCQQLEMQMTVSHNPKFPAAFCDSSRMQICYWRKPIGFPVWKDWTQKKPLAFCERLWMQMECFLPATRNANDRVPQSKVPSCILWQ